MGILRVPAAGEYAPYYGKYVELVGKGDILDVLSDELDRTRSLLGSVPLELEGHRYAAGKWTIRDTVGHLIDTERLFTYRAMSFARGDAGPLPGMDQNQWAGEAGADDTPLPDLARELAAVRTSTIGFFARLGPDTLMRRGIASDVEFTVRALAYIIAGHEIHHRTILEDQYGLAEI